jgi:hypothetical protein
VRVAQKYGIFKAFSEKGERPMTVAQLSDQTQLESSILESLLDYMKTRYMFEEVKSSNY